MSKRFLIIIAFLSLVGGVFFTFRQNTKVNLSKAPSPEPVTSVVLPSEEPLPASSAQVANSEVVQSSVKIKLLDSTSWIEHACGPITYKLPVDLKNICISNNENEFDVKVTKEGEYGTRADILVRKYDGGSRRQYWMRTMGASNTEDLGKYVKFQESLFGQVSGLDVFASGGWWQGGWSSPILIAKGTTIVGIYGGRDFRDQEGGKIVRSDFTDTIASTIRFKLE